MSNDLDNNEPRRRRRPASAEPDTVTVGCKLPNGLLLQNFVMENYQEQVMGGGTRTSQRAVRLEETYRICGNSLDISKMALGEVPNLIIGGYGITSGIPRVFWDEWLRANKDAAYVKNGLVFAEDSEARARKRAAEGAKLRSGLEPIDPLAPSTAAPDMRSIQRGTQTAA
jgi:hypothetical protein